MPNALRPRSRRRRVVWWFVATTLPALLALTWLGRVVVHQDRMLERDRRQAAADQAADVAVAALARTLAEFDQHLSGVAAGAGPSGPAAERAAFIVFNHTGVLSRAGVALPYYPAVSPQAPVPASVFATADELEYRGRNATAAVRVLEPLTKGPPAVRAEAWLRLGRIHRKAGDLPRALDAYSQIASMDDVQVHGTPASLLARAGRGLLLAESKRDVDLAREATQLAADLESGRWVLTQPQYEHHIRQASLWGGGTGVTAVDATRQTLVAAAESLFGEWRVERSDDGRRAPRIDWVTDRPVLVLARETRGAVAVLLAEASVLQEAWFANLPAHLTAESGTIDVALTDSSRRVVVGTPAAVAAARTVRAASVTALPWNVLVADRGAGTAMSSEAALMLAGVGLMAFVALAAGYAITRAVSREMRVAQLQSDFVAAVSHEFRTPLTTIRQLSELLARGRVSTPARRQEFLETMVSESDRLQRLIEDLLDFGRMETGRLALRFAPVDVGGLLGDVVAAATKDGTAGGHVVEVTVPPGLPAVRGDREALTHVFRNLLDNAVKYSPGRDRVWVSAANGGGRIGVSVRDHGLGIPAGEQREIFQKFVRGAAPTLASIKGTGIGLAMAKLIVDAHGGTIGVESVPGEGSTFTVALPVAPP
jgi:signal transduction histidine kinase